MKRFVVLIIMIVWIVLPQQAFADSRYPEEQQSFDIDYNEIEKALEGDTQGISTISFTEIVNKFLEGNFLDALQLSLQLLYEKTLLQIKTNWKTMIQLIGIALIAAVFANVSSAFSQQFVAETGFYLTYMMMAVLLAASFAGAVTMAQDILTKLTSLMNAMIPVYATAVTYAVGITTGHMWHQFLMILVVVVDGFLTGIVIRTIKVYVVIAMVNQIASQDYFSKMTELLGGAIHWSLKTILAVTLGLNVIQNMLLPVFDTVKNGWVVKLASAIPGIGSTFGMAAQTAMASAALLKNAIGAACVVTLCIVCLWPMIQMLLMTIMYKILEVLIQPVTDKRLLACIHAVGEGIYMLCKCVATVLLLFILSLAMMCTFSGSNAIV